MSNSDFFCSPTNVSRYIGPYGYIRCTCERFPKITHINSQMIAYLERTDKDPDLEDFLKENIFFTMIPFEEREVFRKYLDEALGSDTPILIEHYIRCGNLTRKKCFGWMSVETVPGGEKEYVLIYMPKKEDRKENIQTTTYFQAFENTYDVIFEMDLQDRVIECVHGKDTSDIGALYDAVMTLDSAKEFWLNHFIYKEDKEVMKTYLERVCSLTDDWDGKTTLQAKFRLQREDGRMRDYISIAIKLNPETVLFCTKKMDNQRFVMSDTNEAVALSRLDKWIGRFVKNGQNVLGVMLYEKDLKEDCYSVVYASEAIRSYLGIGREEYLRLISQEISDENCLNTFRFQRERFEELVSEGELRSKCQMTDGREKEVLFICRDYSYQNATIYEVLMLDEAAGGSSDIPATGVFIRTFGHFDVFCNGQPITFTSSKEKELMALLVDRNGGTLTANEAIAFLWEDEEADERTSAKYRKLAMGLKNTLEKYNIGHILVNHRGVRNIDVGAVTCDYYELLAGNKRYQKMFHNVYMSNYSWAEDTLATLWDYS